MHEGSRFERREPLRSAPPLRVQGLEREHAANHVLGLQGRVDPRLDSRDLRVEVSQFGPEAAGDHGRRTSHGHPLESVGLPGLERGQRGDRGIGRIDPLDRLAQVAEHTGDGGAVEARGEFVEPAAAALGLERPQFVELVEAKRHHAGERGFVDVTDDVLEVDLVAGVVVVPGINVGDPHQIPGIAAKPDHVVGIALVGERAEFGALVPPLDRDQGLVGRHANQQPAGARLPGIEHAAAEQPLEAEENCADKLQQRGLAGLVGAVEHLHAGAESVDGGAVEGSEAFHLDAFDEHGRLRDSSVSGGR